MSDRSERHNVALFTAIWPQRSDPHARLTEQCLRRIVELHGEPHFPATPSASLLFSHFASLVSSRGERSAWPLIYLLSFLRDEFETFCKKRFDHLFMKFMVACPADRHLLRFLLVHNSQPGGSQKRSASRHSFASVVGCDILHLFMVHVTSSTRPSSTERGGRFAAFLPPKCPPEVASLAELAVPLLVRASLRYSKRQTTGVLFHPAIAAAKAWTGELPKPPIVRAANEHHADDGDEMLDPLDVRNASTSLSSFVSAIALHKRLAMEPPVPVRSNRQPLPARPSKLPQAPKPKPSRRTRRASPTSSDETSSSEESSSCDDDSSSSSSETPPRCRRPQKASRTEPSASNTKVSPTLREIIGRKATKPKR
jgi:hypothetical protein